MKTDSARTFFPLYWVATTFVATGMAVAWWISPLGLGFAQWPDEPTKSLVIWVYQASYFAGIPLLLLSQGTSIALAKFRQLRWAYAVPAISIALFLTLTVIVLAQVKLS